MTSDNSFEAAFAQRPELQKRIVQSIGTSFAPGEATRLTGVPLQPMPQISRGYSGTLHTTSILSSTLGSKTRRALKMKPRRRSESWNIDQSSQPGGTKAPIAPSPMYPFPYRSGRSIICKWAKRPEYGHPAPLLVEPPSNLE